MRIRALLLMFVFFATAAYGETLSRAEAVAVALRANPEAVKGREQIRYYEGRITEERAAALPEVTANGTLFRYTDPSFLNSTGFDEFPAELQSSFRPQASNMYEGALQVRQTLYSFKLNRAIKAAKLARTVGAADLQRIQQRIALDTVEAYNGLLFAQEQVRVAQNALERRQKHADMTRNRRAAGVATELEVLRANVDLENQRAEVVRAEGGVELARANLNALMLRPIDAPITPTDKLTYEVVPTTLAEVLKAALASRPELEVAQTTENIRSELVGIAKAESKPSFDFMASYGHSSRRPENWWQNDFAKWNMAFNMKIPIFDGRRTAGKVVQAEAEVEKAKQDRVALQNQIRVEAMNVITRLNVAGRLITAAQLNVEQARKALDMTQANYNYGAATVLDVTDAQNSLVQSEMTLAQALQEHANARATLNYVMGRDPLEAPNAH